MSEPSLHHTLPSVKQGRKVRPQVTAKVTLTQPLGHPEPWMVAAHSTLQLLGSLHCFWDKVLTLLLEQKAEYQNKSFPFTKHC